MKKFFLNIFLFSAIFFILNQLPNLFLSPYYGKELYLKKYEYFINNQDNFNTVILGSSQSYRQINPEILDGLLKDYQTSTFNLAAEAIFNPEVYYLYEKLLETIETNSLKYAFIELRLLEDMRSNSLNQSWNYYWHNLEYLNFSINYTLASNRPLWEKIKVIKKYIICYVNKIINGYKALVCNKSNENGLYYGKDGFYSLNEEMSDIGGNNYLRKILASFLKDTTVLEKKVSRANRVFSVKNNEQFINEVHLIKLIDLIEKSKQKGVHLIFVIPPRGVYNELLAIKEKLPSNHIIEIANPQKYPELYQVEFTFDKWHVNKKGADLYTKYIANELIKNVFKHRFIH